MIVQTGLRHAELSRDVRIAEAVIATRLHQAFGDIQDAAGRLPGIGSSASCCAAGRCGLHCLCHVA